MNFDVDAIVAGAGPTGLMLAGDLARAGVSCTVFEPRPRRSELTRAFAVHARTLEELDARGIAHELAATGTPVPELRFFGDAALDLSQLPSRFPYLLVTPQYETERVLEERASSLGADIQRGVEVSGLTQRPDGVEVRVTGTDGQERLVRAPYLVGADGMHSRDRECQGIPFPGKPVVRSVMLAEVRLTSPPPDVLTVNTAGDAFAIIAPFGDGWYRVIAWHRKSQPPESTPVSLDEVSDVTRQALGADYGMHDAQWMSRFHSEERQVPGYRDGRVLLAGDAAHVHSPAGGQGMNTGIQDAANLGWKLAATVQGWARDGLLDSYNAERHPVGRQVLRGSSALLRIGLTGPRGLVSARNLVALAATRIPFITRPLAGAISGLSISYPAPRGAHPLTGKRAPDLPLADGGRLYEALRGGQFVLAASPGALPATATAGFGRVETVTVARRPGLLALVRPDAYVAWAANPANGRAGRARKAGTRTDGDRAAEIRGVLERWCGNPSPAAREA